MNRNATFNIAMTSDIGIGKPGYFKEVKGDDISKHPLVVKSFSPTAIKKMKLFVHDFQNEIEGGYHVSSAVNGVRITSGYGQEKRYQSIIDAVARIKKIGLKTIYKNLYSR